jgi:minor extracellular serine protease Vpr
VRAGFRAIATAFAASVVVLVPGALASEKNGAASMALDSPTGAWFVELNGSVDSFRSKSKAAGIGFSERYVYKKVWKGLSISAAADDVAKIKHLDGVKAVYPVLTATVGPTEQADPELVHALAMTGADNAQEEPLGYTGEGIKVAVMDTGVDYDNPALGSCFGPGCRVVTGYDFVGDRFNASGSGGSLILHPDNDPDDCNGHGSHVAGIVGADGTVNAVEITGVAPEVTFGAYRVFGCQGSTTTDIMLAAMERALNDGMDVLNMSIGSSFNTHPQYPTAVGSDALVDAGMTVVASIGNSGANGLFSAGAPGVGKKVIGVASYDNSHVELKTFTVTPADLEVGYSQASGSPDAPTSGSLPLSKTGTPTTTNDGCTGSPTFPAPGSQTGNAVLIRRGTCTFYEKARNAQLAGAAAVVLYNNAPGPFSATVAVQPGVGDQQPVTIPVVSVSGDQGAAINNAIASGTPQTLNWTDQTGVFVNPTGGLLSSFSSYGLNAELDLKPNIGAPGGLIRSTWPMEQGGVTTISGTSMSSPHVAGAVALLLQAKPGTSPAMVKTILQNSADPRPWSGNPGAGFLDFVHRQGAGMVDIDDAITAETLVTPGEISLGEGTGGTAVLTIANNSDSDVTYALSHQSALSNNLNTFAPGAFTTAATVTYSQGGSAVTSVNVPAGGSAEVDVSIAISPAATAADRRLYGGYLRIVGAGQTFRVPYAGLRGDYQSIQVLAAGGCSFPGLFKRGGETTCVAATPTTPALKLNGAFTRQADGATYNVADSKDRPVVLYHRAHQSRRIEIRAIDSGGVSHLVAFSDFVSRNQTNDREPTGYTVYTWDGKEIKVGNNGKLHRTELPNGQYQLQIWIEKTRMASDPTVQTETWTSAPFTITRTG